MSMDINNILNVNIGNALVEVDYDLLDNKNVKSTHVLYLNYLISTSKKFEQKRIYPHLKIFDDKIKFIYGGMNFNPSFDKWYEGFKY